jgi:hypothetical protein
MPVACKVNVRAANHDAFSTTGCLDDTSTQHIGRPPRAQWPLLPSGRIQLTEKGSSLKMAGTIMLNNLVERTKIEDLMWPYVLFPGVEYYWAILHHELRSNKAKDRKIIHQHVLLCIEELQILLKLIGGPRWSLKNNSKTWTIPTAPLYVDQ